VVAYESLKTKEKPSRAIPKVVALAYGSGRLHESFWLQSLSHSSNGASQRWSLLELIAYESGRKESFDCILYCRYSENMLLWAMELSEVSGENALILLLKQNEIPGADYNFYHYPGNPLAHNSETSKHFVKWTLYTSMMVDLSFARTSKTFKLKLDF